MSRKSVLAMCRDSRRKSDAFLSSFMRQNITGGQVSFEPLAIDADVSQRMPVERRRELTELHPRGNALASLLRNETLESQLSSSPWGDQASLTVGIHPISPCQSKNGYLSALRIERLCLAAWRDSRLMIQSVAEAVE